MSLYTKGKWTAKGHNVECVRDGIKVTLAHCGLIAVKYSDRRGYVEAIHKKRDKEVKANAHLIAAAPKLLAACEYVLNDAIALSNTMKEKLRRAIAEATKL